MNKRVSLPGTILSLGFLSVAIYSAGCSSDSSGGAGGAAGGKGGSTAAGGKGGSTGVGGGGKGGSTAVGGAAGGASGGAAGGANGGAAGGANGGAAGGANGGAAGGAKGGAGGANGGAAGGKAGAAGGSNGGAAGGAGGSTLAATLCPSTGGMYTATSTAKMSPSEFCDLFLMTCGSAVAGHTTKAECMSTYGSTQNMTVASGSSNGTIGACESYHLCNAVSAPAGHCPHAAGTAICVAPTP